MDAERETGHELRRLVGQFEELVAVNRAQQAAILAALDRLNFDERLAAITAAR
jgi:hypothetical protein